MDDAKIKPRLGGGELYFMRMGQFVKIGIAGAPSLRRRDLQTGSPYKIMILASFLGWKDEEEKMHKRFHSLRISTEGAGNEWFKLTAGLMFYIWWLCKLHERVPSLELKRYIETGRLSRAY